MKLDKRRTYYALSNKSTITDQEIENIINNAVLNVPSAFNSQSTRIVLLLNSQHQQLWDITKEVLSKIVSKETFSNTKAKIDGSFASGYGTILFYEDQQVIEHLQKSFTAYSEKFPAWSEHTSAMHQYVIWTHLEDAGMGASLQHYNPIIDEAVAHNWNINPKWRLIAQMPFGVATQPAGDKEFAPLSDRIKVFK